MQRDDAYWSHGILQDLVSVCDADRDQPKGAKLLLRAVIKAMDRRTGQAHLGDAAALVAVGLKDRTSLYRARKPLIAGGYVSTTPGRFGAVTVYVLTMSKEVITERLQALKEAKRSARQRSTLETAARYVAFREKNNAKTETCDMPAVSQHEPKLQRCKTATPISFKGSLVDREVIGEVIKEETSLPSHPAIDIRAQAIRHRLQAARSASAVEPAIDHDHHVLFREWFEERAGVLEFDAGLPRRLAELRARADALAKFGSLQPMELE